MQPTAAILLFAACVSGMCREAVADEPVTLMGTISQWIYPKSEIHGAEMSDAATVNSEGNRTMQSMVCKTTMTTDDPIADVLAFYKTKLTPDKNADTKTTSTTLIISRADGEKQTHIVWKHYVRL